MQRDKHSFLAMQEGFVSVHVQFVHLKKERLSCHIEYVHLHIVITNFDSIGDWGKKRGRREEGREGDGENYTTDTIPYVRYSIYDYTMLLLT